MLFTAPKLSWNTRTSTYKIILCCNVFSSLFLYSVAWYSCQSCLDRLFVCPPLAIPFCHVLSYTLCFSIFFWCDFNCVMFLWIMLHFISHTYCILCWDSPSSPLWVWFIGSWWDLAMSLSLNYVLLYQLINPLACWFVAELFTAFPALHCWTMEWDNRHTHVHTCSLCRDRREFLPALRIVETQGQP
jgi:hypothetical protein